MNTSLLVVSASAALVSSAHAGFLGFVASVRTSGAYTLVDVYVGVQNASDRFLNVYNANITTAVSGGFTQNADFWQKTWRPDGTNYTSTRNGLDSFMTAGGTDYLLPMGSFAADSTSGDPNFTQTSWTPTVNSAPATTVPLNAGWYTNDPFAATNASEGLAGLEGRVDGSGAAGAQYGIWCSHLVLATNSAINFGQLASSNLFYGAWASVKDGVTGATTQGYSAIPAPGAAAMVALAGMASRRRRH
jgi:hypothetical protein